MWTNPIETLLAFLGDPDPRLWLSRAEAVTAAALRGASAKSTCDTGGAAERITAALHGEPLPPDAPGRIAVCSGADTSGCPLTIVLDQRDRPAFSAFTVIDDRDETIRADTQTHRRRWAAWLYWGNLLQFLDFGSGDSGQLAFTGLPGFDASRLAAAGGDGYLSALSLAPLDEDLADDDRLGDDTPVRRIRPVDPAPMPPVPAPGPPPPTEEPAGPGRWDAVLDLLDPDDEGRLELFVDATVVWGRVPG
jgi:hypothetical protein